MKLIKHLANLGYGSRRDVMAIVRDGRVTNTAGEVIDDEGYSQFATLLVDGEPVDPPPGMLLLMHKPVGYTCSTVDPDSVIYDLLPPRFAHRKPALSPVGRLDKDTSGLLLMTDDGTLLHKLTSPKHKVAKIYEATLAQPLRGDEAELFMSGTLMLQGEAAALAPATLEVLTPTEVRVTLTEGRYHQVRRMFGAVGNEVLTLHRSQVGALTLGDLPEGEWRLVGRDEL